jgi:tetratricopeptide (TPR) repeat protein
MREAAGRASRYNLSASADWQAVLTCFDLGTGFDFIVLLVTDEEGAETCRAALARRLESAGKRLLEIPTASRENLEDLANPLVYPAPAPDAGAVWVSRVVHAAEPDAAAWKKSWAIAAARLNQFRNPFRRAWTVPVVFVGAPWLQVVLRENAPDLWSVRTTVAVVEPVPQVVEAQARMTMGEAPAGRGPDPDMALAEVAKLRAAGAPELPVARMLYRAGLGFVARYQWQEARQAFAECLDIRKRAGAGAEDLADVHTQLGLTLSWLTDYAAACAEYEEALRLYRQVGDVLGEATCIRSLGDTALDRSDHAEARQRYETALPLYRQVGSVLGEANCIHSLGNIALARSDHAEARQRYEAALLLYRQVGNVLGEANCIWSLGQIAFERSDHAEARQRFETALPLHRQVGNVLGEANCIQSFGDLAFERSDHAEARQRFETALPLHRQAGDVLGEANCIRSLGDLALAQSHRAEARRAFEQALSLYQRIEEPCSVGRTHRRLARIAEDPADRTGHVQAARGAWLSIGRADLIQQLDKEFPSG